MGVTRVKAISPGNLPKREKAVEQEGRDVHDVRTLACMKASGVPPTTFISFGPITRENSWQAIKILGIGADPWVMRIIQWGTGSPL